MQPVSTTAVRGSVRSDDVEATRALGRTLGESAMPGTVLALSGELGAGKTQLAKGVAAGLGIQSVVNSPTFVLMNEHLGRLRLFHVDAYRLADPEEAAAAGLLDDRAASGIVVVEWADRLDGWLPDERLDVRIDLVEGKPSSRLLAWTAYGPQHEALATAMERAS